MRSDREEIPAPFTKADADKAETMEARSRMARVAAGCQVYWPSPYEVCGVIRDKYNSLGGPASFLSFPSSAELTNPGNTGKRTQFLNGPIYWSAATGAHPVVNSFLNRWGMHQYEAGWLKYPTTDEIVLPDGGRRQEFQQGAIYVAFQNAVGSAIQNGPLRDKYNSVGGLTPGSSFLGYLTEDHKRSLPNTPGQMARFQNGVIYWHPTHGAYAIRGDILEQWSLAGYESSPYGYPTSDATDDGTGWFTQQFSNGTKISGEITTPPILTPVQYIEFATKEEAIAYFDSQETARNGQAQPQAKAAPISVEYGPCTLIPNYLHWRTKSGPGAGNGVVGYKPKTNCTTAVSSIEHDTDLKYKYYTLWLTALTATDSAVNTRQLEQKNLAFSCTGDVDTNFWGRTIGTINYGGKNYYAIVNPPQKRFDCEV